jgi:hypothetical protein
MGEGKKERNEKFENNIYTESERERDKSVDVRKTKSK